MKVPGTKINGKFIANPGMGIIAKNFWEAIKDGTPLIKTMEVVRKSKSGKQLGAIFGLMLTRAAVELADKGWDTSYIYKLDNPTGIEISVDDLKQYFYTVCPIYNEEGIRISLSKSNTKEAAKFFDDCRNYLASQWEIHVPEPDPSYKDKK